MTVTEAKMMFGIRKNDELCADNIKVMIDSTMQYLGQWSISKADRRKAEKEIDALITLYKEAVK